MEGVGTVLWIDEPECVQAVHRLGTRAPQATAEAAASHPDWPRFRMGINTGPARALPWSATWARSKCPVDRNGLGRPWSLPRFRLLDDHPREPTILRMTSSVASFPDAMLAAFGVVEAPVILAGGKGGTWRAGRLALKPVEFLAETLWRAEVLTQLPDSTEFRVARPVRALDEAG